MPKTAEMEQETYVMPKIELGTGVLWYHGGRPTDRPSFGFAVRVGPRTLTVAVLDPSLRVPVVHDGVRHVSDPDAMNQETVENGAWDFGPTEKRMVELEKKMSLQAQKVMELMTKVR